MNSEYGPYIQIGRLAEQMANQYHKDEGLELNPLVAHFMDEVEVNVAADSFDHTGFLIKVRAPLRTAASASQKPRRKEFLTAVVEALTTRAQISPATKPVPSVISK
jgi:hypothetical protein